MSDPFTLLGVDEEADDETVRKAYLKMVRVFSPERDPLRFQEVREAYDTIAHAAERLHYRLFRAQKPNPQPLVAAWLREEEKTPAPDSQGLISLLTESLRNYRLPIVGEK